MLTRELEEQFHEQGYCIIPDPVFEGARLDDLNSIVRDVLSRRAPDHRESVDKPHINEPRLLDFLLDERMLDIAESLVGPDIVLGSSHLFYKPPMNGRATPWHSDTMYLEKRLDDARRLVNIWISLDGSDMKNGCLQVIPGSHRWGSEVTQRFTVLRDPEQLLRLQISGIDHSAAVGLTLRSGQVSLHHGSIIHAAVANTSDRPRTGLVVRYLPASVGVVQDRGDLDSLWLARGRSHGRNPYVNEH